MIIGNKVFENYTYVMAIINLTPDSFYSKSRVTADGLMCGVERAIKEGAAVIDLGAQSTRPGHTPISEEEELERLIKPLESVVTNFDIPVSVDTFSPVCARAALAAGAQMINDVSGLAHKGMAEAIAEANASVCIMHGQTAPVVGDVFSAVLPFLKDAAALAVRAGVEPGRILLDGGIGFPKTKEQSLRLLNGYSRLSEAGYPLLLGASRKSLFGGRVEERLTPTLESTRLAVRSGVLFVRVHDVKENVEAIKKEYERNSN